jgi:radical SAM superfamily enzyme YgiQ (UPF0313 family)
VRIAIVNPSAGYSQEYPPVGALSLATCAAREGHEVGFFDEGALMDRRETVLDFLDRFRPQMVGLSLYTTNLLHTYWLVRLIRSNHPDARIVVGGPHFTAMPERTLEECPEIDYGVLGEGEITLTKLLEALDQGRGAGDVAGLFLRNGDGLQFTGARETVKNLDEIPFPDSGFLRGFQYPGDDVRLGSRLGTIVTSRGCPFDCNFCNKSVFGSTYRRRSPEHVAAEIRHQVDVLGIDSVYFQDDLFAVNADWLQRLYRAMEAEGLRLPWKCLGRAGALSAEAYADMARHGCYLVSFGVEAGNPEVLERTGKRLTREQIREGFRQARRAGLQTYGFFIFGHPGEGLEEIRETFAFCRELAPDFVSFFNLVPFPGTGVYELLPDNLKGDWRHIRYTGWHQGDPISLCELPAVELRRLESEAYPDYYGRVGYLLRNVLGRRAAGQLRRNKFWRFQGQLRVRLTRRLKGGRWRVF